MALDFPSPRVAPRDLVRQLKDIDPTLELVWLDGKWILGSVRYDRRLHDVGVRLLQSCRRWATRTDLRKVIMARAHMQGFRVIAMYDHEADGRILEDMREREWRFRHRWKEELQEAEEHSEGIPQRVANERAAVARFDALARDHYRRAFRGAVTFQSPGIPKVMPIAA